MRSIERKQPNSRTERRGPGRPRKTALADAMYVRFPKAMDRWIRRGAKEGDRSFSEQVTRVVRAAMEQQS